MRTLYVEYKDDVTGVTLARKLMMLGKNLQYVGLLEEAAKIMEEVATSRNGCPSPFAPETMALRRITDSREHTAHTAHGCHQ